MSEVNTSKLVEHYETSRALQFSLEDRREKLLYLTVMAFCFLYLDQLNRVSVGALVAKLIEKEAGANFDLAIPFLRPVVWAIVSYACLKYLQSVQHVEDNYTYIHKLENILSKKFPAPAFRKEGLHYKGTSSLYRTAVMLYYKYGVPIFLLWAAGWAKHAEFLSEQSDSISKGLSILVVLMLLTSWWSTELSHRFKKVLQWYRQPKKRKKGR